MPEFHDDDFLAAVRALPCIACGRHPTPSYPTEAHHILGRGAHGRIDAWWNIIPLCHLHHTAGGVGVAWHQGWKSFLENFPHVTEHLVKLGWEFLNGKMFHPERAKL